MAFEQCTEPVSFLQARLQQGPPVIAARYMVLWNYVCTCGGFCREAGMKRSGTTD